MTKSTFNEVSRIDRIVQDLGLTSMEKADYWLYQKTELLGKSPGQILSSRSPDQIIDAFEKGVPEFKGIFDSMRGDADLKNAFKEFLVKDETAFSGLQEMMNNPNAVEGWAKFEDALKDPRKREILTTALKNASAQDDIKFAHVNEFIASVSSYDPSQTSISDTRLSKAMIGVGIPEDSVNGIIQEGKMDAIKNALAGAFDNPEGLLGKFGNLLSQFLPQEWVQGFIGMLSNFGQLMGGAPEFLSNFWNSPGNDHLRAYNQNHIQPAIRGAVREGQRVMNGEERSFQVNADGQTSNFKVEDFKEKYQVAIGKYGRDANNPQHVRAAMIEADPKLHDELDQMLQNNQTSDKFNATAKTGFSLEKIGAFYKKISETHNVDYGAKALGLGGS